MVDQIQIHNIFNKQIFTQETIYQYACLICSVDNICFIFVQFNDNKVANWDDLKELESIKKLATVYLERNPIYYDQDGKPDPNYRRKIMLALPHIQQIDATLCK